MQFFFFFWIIRCNGVTLKEICIVKWKYAPSKVRVRLQIYAYRLIRNIPLWEGDRGECIFGIFRSKAFYLFIYFFFFSIAYFIFGSPKNNRSVLIINAVWVRGRSWHLQPSSPPKQNISCTFCFTVCRCSRSVWQWLSANLLKTPLLLFTMLSLHPLPQTPSLGFGAQTNCSLGPIWNEI